MVREGYIFPLASRGASLLGHIEEEVKACARTGTEPSKSCTLQELYKELEAEDRRITAIQKKLEPEAKSLAEFLNQRHFASSIDLVNELADYFSKRDPQTKVTCSKLEKMMEANNHTDEFSRKEPRDTSDLFVYRLLVTAQA